MDLTPRSVVYELDFESSGSARSYKLAVARGSLWLLRVSRRQNVTPHISCTYLLLAIDFLRRAEFRCACGALQSRCPTYSQQIRNTADEIVFVRDTGGCSDLHRYPRKARKKVSR